MSETEVRTESVHVMLTPGEKERFEAAAQKRGEELHIHLGVSTWMRMLALEATKPEEAARP